MYNNVSCHNPIMQCGHAANSMGKQAGETKDRPACAICGCFEIANEQPVPELRKARCIYYGQKIERRGGCDYPKRTHPEDNICRCEADSNTDVLPFFKSQPDQEFDEFYCGCAFGWE